MRQDYGEFRLHWLLVLAKVLGPKGVGNGSGDLLLVGLPQSMP